MSMQSEHAPLTPEDFFAWLPGQEGRFELVGGEVVMMAGAGRRHDAIVVNLISAVNSQTRGGPCQTFTGDTYVATAGSNRRMPDMGVDRGAPNDNALVADKPSLVVEVLSPTTGGFDVTVKLAEYQGVQSLDYILFVDTESPTVHIYRRDEDRLWHDEVLGGLDAVVELAKLRVSLSLRDIYEGLEFAEAEAGPGSCRRAKHPFPAVLSDTPGFYGGCFVADRGANAHGGDTGPGFTKRWRLGRRERRASAAACA